jgi:hypothetical protein
LGAKHDRNNETKNDFLLLALVVPRSVDFNLLLHFLQKKIENAIIRLEY